MKASKQARREAKQLFRACQENGLLDENRARQAVDQILAARPRGYLGILGHFQRLLKLDADRHLARVESAVPLSAWNAFTDPA
jgi:F-type H+-transporting ATPase subunit delta